MKMILRISVSGTGIMCAKSVSGIMRRPHSLSWSINCCGSYNDNEFVDCPYKISRCWNRSYSRCNNSSSLDCIAWFWSCCGSTFRGRPL